MTALLSCQIQMHILFVIDLCHSQAAWKTSESLVAFLLGFRSIKKLFREKKVSEKERNLLLLAG